MNQVAEHYAQGSDVVAAIADSLRRAGKDLGALTTADLAAVDEFHIRGREATLEIGRALGIGPASDVLDIGSGLGGPARTLAQNFGCHVTGVDVTPAFCAAAETLSDWVHLADKVAFRVADATRLPFAEATFDAAMTLHVGMNIARKDLVYSEARRVLRRGGRFAVYDVLQGEGGEVLYPVPWARDPAISFLASPDQMRSLLQEAGFRLLDIEDSTEDAQSWFEAMATRIAASGTPAVTFQAFLGNDFPQMARNQVANLKERRIRTVLYVCEA